MANLAFDRQRSRWYPLIDHPMQQDLIKAVGNGVRFPLVPAGRRSGKTERFKRFLVKQAAKVEGLYFAAAPTYNQAKKIFWKDLKDFSLSSTLPRKPSESELQIYLPNGSEIHVIGLDKPERIEGVPWTGGGIDEFADVKPGAWESNIFPALNTVNPLNPDYRAWCWLFGVPDGLNHYYDLCSAAETGVDPDYKVFHWKSADILPQDVIDAAKRALSPRQYKQEFEGSFETATGLIYEDYSSANHTDAVFEDGPIIWSHDFNYLPMSSFIAQSDEEGNTYCVDEIVLEHAIARQSAEEFVARYENHTRCPVIVYGDPSGRAGEKHGHISDYLEIEDVLQKAGFTVERRVKASTRSIRDGQSALRARILNTLGERRFFVNPEKCPTLDKGLSTVQILKGSTYMEDEKNPAQHITTAARYYAEFEFPVHGQPRIEIT